MALQKLSDKKAMTDRVADLIREAIFEGSLQPGEHLQEERIASETGVSRGPVREALVKLEAEGLLVREPYRGARVATVSRSDLEELFILRQHLEALAVTLAAPHISPSDIEHLREIIAAKKRTEPDGDGRQERLNQEFHQVLYDRCPNRRLHAFLVQLWSQFPKSMWRLRPYRIRENIDEFEGIVRTLESGDAEAAGAWMAKHVAEGARSILEIFDQHQDAALPADSRGSATRPMAKLNL